MIYSEWYIKNTSGKGNIKVIPKSLDNYLTPLALAI
jgi:ubiquinol-cytochrome c reductase cytochrome b subunit